MLKYIFPILIFTLYAQDNITPYDLIKFENKYYIANSYDPYSGKVLDYYDNGIKKLEGHYANGIKDGVWLEFYDSGKLKSETIHNNNQAAYTSFFESGEIKLFGLLINDLKYGLWIRFDTEGNERIHSFFSMGILESEVEIDIPTKPEKKVVLKSDLKIENLSEADITIEIDKINLELKNGEYITYFDSGKYLVEFYEDNLLEGVSTLYYKSDKKNIVRSFSKGKIDARTYEYDELGILKSMYQETFDEDNNLLKHGEYISYHLNESIYEMGQLQNGYRFGEWFMYDNNSTKEKDVSYDLETKDDNSDFIKANVISYYDSGKIESRYSAFYHINCDYLNECTVYDGVQHSKEIKNGLFISFYNNGALKEKGEYYNNVKDGWWNGYYKSGKISYNIDYIEGSGAYTSFYDMKNTLTKKLGYYTDEVKNGLWRDYNPDGELLRSYYYRNDLLDVNKPMNIYYTSDDISLINQDDLVYAYDIDNPSVKSSFYCKGIAEDYTFDGAYDEYYINNNIKSTGIYKNGIKFSYWKEYYEDETLKSQIVFDDVGSGKYESYLKSGEISSVGSYKNYLRDGKWITYYSDGGVEWILFFLNDKINPNKLCSNWYQNGYKRIEGYLVLYNDDIIWDGKYIEYYDNGIIYLNGNFSFNKKTGTWLEYYPNRVLKSQGDYSEDKVVGKWNYFNDKGDLIKTESYE